MIDKEKCLETCLKSNYYDKLKVFYAKFIYQMIRKWKNVNFIRC